MAYRTSAEAVLAWGVDNLGSGLPLAIRAAELPALPQLMAAGMAPAPQVSAEEGIKAGYGAGSRAPLYVQQGLRNYSVSAAVEVGRTTVNLLRHCLATSGLGGYKGIPDLTFAVVRSEAGDSMRSRAYRCGKCNQLNLAWREGGAAPMTASIDFWALAEQTFSGTLPAVSTLQQPRAPFLWQNVMSWRINGAEFRGVLSSASISINNNLNRVGCRPDNGAQDPLSRTSYLLSPRHLTETISLTLADDLHDSFVRATRNSPDWGTVEVTCSAVLDHLQFPHGTLSNHVPIVAGMSITMNMARLQKHGQESAEPGATLSFSNSALVSGVTIAAL